VEVNTRNFRTDLDDYVGDLLMYQKPTVKCSTPFIVISSGFKVEVKGIYHIRDLLEEMDDSLVFHTWVGKWRADIFHYTIGEIRRLLRDHGYFTKWI